MQKLRIGVLMGGKSAELEVSFNSGRTVCDHLDTARYEIIPIFQAHCGALYILPWYFLHRGKTTDFQGRLKSQAREICWDDLKQLIDLAYIAMHGRYAEDGVLQGLLEVLDIPYVGSRILASALCMDKIIQKVFFKSAGIAVPYDIVLYPHEIRSLSLPDVMNRLAQQDIQLPCIVKPHKEGSSLGVSIVFSPDELEDAIHRASTVGGGHQAVLIEERIVGMEFSCVTIVDYKKNAYLFMPPTEIVPDAGTYFYDYDQKYMPGRAVKFTPPRCSEQQITLIQETCARVMRLLDITTLSRIEGFLTPDNRVVIVEANTFSGMAPSSFIFREAAEINMSHTRLINHLIETELHARGMLDAIVKREQVHDEKSESKRKKLRIAVLMGGATNEREVSLDSGRNVVYKLSPRLYEVTPLFVSSKNELFEIGQSLLVRNATHEIEYELSRANPVRWSELKERFDFVFNALHGGLGENGGIQGILEMLGIPYNGSGVLASALCMDKVRTNEFLQAQGFDVPRNVFVTRDGWLHTPQAELDRVMAALPFPLIVKPHDDGCSVMVSKVHSRQELEHAIVNIIERGKGGALVEECIIGMELTVGVVGNEEPCALPPSRAVASAGVLSIEEKFLPGAGENQTPAPLSAHAMSLVMRTMERAYKAIGCQGYCRIDCFYQPPAESPTGKERVVFLEFNTLPALTPATCLFHQAAEVGIKPMDFIDLIVQLGLQAHGAAHEQMSDSQCMIFARAREYQAPTF